MAGLDEVERYLAGEREGYEIYTPDDASVIESPRSELVEE